MRELDVYSPDSSDEDGHGWVLVDGIRYTPDQARDLARTIAEAATFAERERAQEGYVDLYAAE